MIVALWVAVVVLTAAVVLLWKLHVIDQRDALRSEAQLRQDMIDAFDQVNDDIAAIHADHTRFKKANWDDMLNIFGKELDSRRAAAANATATLADNELELRVLREEKRTRS